MGLNMVNSTFVSLKNGEFAPFFQENPLDSCKQKFVTMWQKIATNKP